MEILVKDEKFYIKRKIACCLSDTSKWQCSSVYPKKLDAVL
jgi:hypothetical protein